MPVNLSIKNAPDELVRQLRARAERHHRSLQGELPAIIEEAVRTDLHTPTEAADLTAHDASYLWLAREPGAEPVTLDRHLAQAGTAGA